MFIGEPSRACFKCSASQIWGFILEWQKKKRKLFYGFRYRFKFKIVMKLKNILVYSLYP